MYCLHSYPCHQNWPRLALTKSCTTYGSQQHQHRYHSTAARLINHTLESPIGLDRRSELLFLRQNSCPSRCGVSHTSYLHIKLHMHSLGSSFNANFLLFTYISFISIISFSTYGGIFDGIVVPRKLGMIRDLEVELI